MSYIIKSSKGVQQAILNIFGNYIAAFISALSIILISRNLGPTIFGEFSAAFSLGLIFSKINDFGVTIATQKFASQSTNKNETKSFIIFGYKIKIVVSIFLVIISIFLANFFKNIFNFSNIFIAPISIILSLSITYYDQLIATLLATHSFVKAIIVNISQASFKLISAILFTYIFKFQLIPILFLFTAAPAIPMLFKKYFEPKWYRKVEFAQISLNNRDLFINMAKHSALLVFTTGIIDSVGVLFVKNYLNSYQAGLLGGISRISLLFILIGTSLSQVLFNRVSRYTKKNDLQKYILKTFFLSILIILTYFLILPILPFLIKFSIGSDYLIALNTMRFLLASVFIYILSVPYTALFYSFNKNNYFSLSGVIQLLILIVSSYLLIPTYGIIGSAYSQIITRFVLLLFTIIYALLVYKKKYLYEK